MLSDIIDLIRFSVGSIILVNQRDIRSASKKGIDKCVMPIQNAIKIAAGTQIPTIVSSINANMCPSFFAPDFQHPR